jgi:glycerol-3-phosphate acyltransferase PlsX
MSSPVQGEFIRIALDAMGGDFAPDNEIQGVIEAFANGLDSTKYQIVLYGKKDLIIEKLKLYNATNLNLTVVDCQEVITMDDDPTTVLKTKKDSSIFKGISELKEAKTNAFISAGNTGAMLSISTVVLGRIKGVSRPTIGTFFPRIDAIPTLIVDAGANAEVKPQFLKEFAIMGSTYAELMFGVENPRVALLNIGEEKSKGTEVVQEAYALLKDSNLNFVGNVEGRDIFFNEADVIVTDGFTGNVVLKFAESIVPFLKHAVKDYSEKSVLNKFKVALLVPTLKEILSDFDYQKYGGVPLLGVNGVIIIGHGKSTPLAIKNMILKAKETIEKGVNQKIESIFKEKN